MNTSLMRVFAALFALVFVIAACASDTGSQWTFAPVVADAGNEAPGDTVGDDVVPVEAGDVTPPGPGGAEVPATDTESVSQELTGEADPAEAAQAESDNTPETLDTQGDAPASEGAAPAAEGGEPRVIDLQATTSLQFTDPNGQQVQDIPVSPGETIIFRIDNTAGFEHNFYIGTDAELSVPSATTETGIANWSSGVQEFEWTAPDDISGLKFGCTVPGHYPTMQGTFSAAEAAPAEDGASGSEDAQPEDPAQPEASAQPEAAQAQSAEPAESAQPAATEAGVEAAQPEASAQPVATEAAAASAQPLATAVAEAQSVATEPAATDHEMADMPVATAALDAVASEAPAGGTTGDSDARVIEMEANAALRFVQDGEQVVDIPVTPGETIIFRVDNTAGFEHNLYIGNDAELSPPYATTDVGIPNWNLGVQELEWTVPDDITDLKFGCTVPGHYPAGMQGTFSVSP